MEIPVELQFLAIFFTMLLIAQALFLLCWLAVRGVMTAVAALRRRAAGDPAERPSDGVGAVG